VKLKNWGAQLWVWSGTLWTRLAKRRTTSSLTTTAPTGTLIKKSDIQRQFDREIFFYDKKRGCQPYQPRDGSEFKGHWEKVQDKIDKYYYVKGMRPSGVPNAQVVSQGEAEIAQPSTIRTTDRYALYQRPWKISII
jgi:hypothetical protein